MKKSCAIVSILIGREPCLVPLLQYFKQVDIPEEFSEVNLYLILACEDEFRVLVEQQVTDLKLTKKYNRITFIEGNKRCYPDLEWEAWGIFTRKNNPSIKHNSTLLNLDIALKSIVEEDLIHLVDDDTIPPSTTLVDLVKTYNRVENCGLASGIYFNKEWIGPSDICGPEELKRRIVGSIDKDNWRESSIDDIALTDYTDIGFTGNGCMLVSTLDIKQLIPLKEPFDSFEQAAPPDFKICYRLRKLGKKISLTPSVVCKHLDERGKEVGLSREYLNNIKERGNENLLKVFISSYIPYIDYKQLVKRFDRVILLTFQETTSRRDQERLMELQKSITVDILQKSLKEVVETYPTVYRVDKDLEILQILNTAFEYIKDKHNYAIYTYRKNLNDIIPIQALNSSNLHTFLNQTP